MSARIGSVRSKSGTIGASKDTVNAWVNYNQGDGNEAITDDYGVSSVTDVGTGLYTVNFSPPMTNSTYTVTASTKENEGAGHTDSIDRYVGPSRTAQYTTELKMAVINLDTGGGRDCLRNNVQVIGD